MDPITLAMLGMSGLQGLFQAGTGIYNLVQANKLKKSGALNMPEYQVPEAVDKYMALAQQAARGDMPGAEQERQGIAQTSAAGVTAASQLADSPVAALGALGRIQGQERASLRDLGIRTAQYRAQAQQNLGQAYLNQAQYQDQAYQYNEFLPWQTAMNQYESYRQAGVQGLMGGADTMGSTAIQGMNMYQNQQWQRNMMPSSAQNGYGFMPPYQAPSIQMPSNNYSFGNR